jgi:hypothetical protein
MANSAGDFLATRLPLTIASSIILAADGAQIFRAYQLNTALAERAVECTRLFLSSLAPPKYSLHSTAYIHFLVEPTSCFTKSALSRGRQNTPLFRVFIVLVTVSAALECAASLFSISYAHTEGNSVGLIDGAAQNMYMVLQNLSLAVSFGLVLGFSFFLSSAWLARTQLDERRCSLLAVHVFWGSALAVLACAAPLLCAAADSHTWDGIFLFCLAASISIAVFFVVSLGRSLVSESTIRRDRNDDTRMPDHGLLGATSETGTVSLDSADILMRSPSAELRKSLLAEDGSVSEHMNMTERIPQPQLAVSTVETKHRGGCLHSLRACGSTILGKFWFDAGDPLFHLKTGTTLFSIVMLGGIIYNFYRAVRNVQSQNPWQPYTTRRYDDPSSLTKFLGDCIALWVIWLPLACSSNQAAWSASASTPDDAPHHQHQSELSDPDHPSPASVSASASRPASKVFQSPNSLSSAAPSSSLRSQMSRAAIAEQHSDSSSDAILMMLASDPEQMEDKISSASLSGSYRAPSILQGSLTPSPASQSRFLS